MLTWLFSEGTVCVAVEVLVAPDLLVLAFIVIFESEADLVSFDSKSCLEECTIPACL